MKSYNRFQSLLLALSAIATTTISAVPQAQAVTFREEQVNQAQFAVVAVPFGYQEHRLEIIEQVPGKKSCWNEFGSAPVKVNLSLLDFDYTGNCRRVINTNGYTLRLNGQDDRVAHILKIVRNNDELQLVAFHKNPNQPSVVIGKTNGLSNSAMKIVLNPGWKITKRVHQGEVIDHLYLSGNSGTANTAYSTTSQTTVNGNSNTSSSTNRNTSSSTSTTVTQGANKGTNTNQVDTQALANSVEQIYTNLVNPLLRNLSQQNTNNGKQQ